MKVGELFLGNKLLILSRQLVVLDYGDGLTKEYCEPKCERYYFCQNVYIMNDQSKCCVYTQSFYHGAS